MEDGEVDVVLVVVAAVPEDGAATGAVCNKPWMFRSLSLGPLHSLSQQTTP